MVQLNIFGKSPRGREAAGAQAAAGFGVTACTTCKDAGNADAAVHLSCSSTRGELLQFVIAQGIAPEDRDAAVAHLQRRLAQSVAGANA